jgi:hypothetical protein
MAKVLTADQTRADHPAQPIVLPNEVRHDRGVHLRNSEHRLRRWVDNLWFHFRRKHDDRIGQAVYNVAPEIQFKPLGLIFPTGS